ncbi:MAG: NADPH:quinone reductase [Vulcanimicrobiota bacterium]
MRAIKVEQFGPPEVMQCGEVTLASPGPGQARVRIEAAGVNPVDTYIRSGAYGRLPELPYTPGRDGSGVVVEVGPDYDGPPVGQRVYLVESLTGTYAEETLCNQSQLYPLPDEANFAQGAAVGIPYTTAYYALIFKGLARPGQRVLIHGGSGGVGLAAVQLAVGLGLQVVATAGTEEGRELILQQGADVALPHADSSFAGPYDLIIEMLANQNLNRDLDMLKPRGRVVVVGNRGPTELDARKTMTQDLTICGIALTNATAEERAQAQAAIGAGLAHGTLRPVIREEMALEEAPQAHQLVLESGALGKIVLRP